MFDDSSCAGGNAAKTAAAAIQQNQANTSFVPEQPDQSIAPEQAPAMQEAPPGMNQFMAGWDSQSGLTAEQEEELAQAFSETDIMGGMPFDGMPEDTEAWLQQYAAQMNTMAPLEPPPAPVYQMFEQNQFAGSVVPLSEGIQAFKRGELKQAIEMLETIVAAGESPDSAEAWRWIGMAQAELDDDRQAIAALLKAVEVDQGNLDALLELGVSCTNELDQTQALCFLETWIEAHPIYGQVIGTVGPASEAVGTIAMTERVIQLFKNASELGQNDADPFMALGVLCNLSRDYDEAANWFKKALQLKPSSHSLWNKLGATQANGSRSRDALHAYNQALALKPTYVRAWINTGISYSNQSQYHDACCYFLKGLSLSPGSDHVWSYVRMAFTCMDRQDLTEKLNSSDKPHPDMFRDDFKF